jgi:DNA transposition AAA+ family ATPase
MRKPKPGHERRVAGHAETLYIKLLLETKGVQPKAVAIDLGVSYHAVCEVLSGRLRSARVEAEIARILGKASWNEVVQEARRAIADIAGEGGAA